MLSARSATRSINESMQRIIRALGIKVSRPREKYFGIETKDWLCNVLLANQTLYTFKNYGRSKQWVIAHVYWRNLADLAQMNLELDALLHHSMWEVLPVARQYKRAIELNRNDCIAIERLKRAFEVIYRTLFVNEHGNRHKLNKINKLVKELLTSQGFTVKMRHIRYLFAQYNHIVIKIGHLYYYNNLKYIN